MNFKFLRCRLMVLTTILLANFIPAIGQVVPPLFSDQLISATWNDVEGFQWDATGRMYVGEKAGKIWIVDTNNVKLPNPLIDISEEVGDWRDHGMNSFVLDPNFLTNGYFYLYYTVDRHYLINFGLPTYNSATNTYFQATIVRVTRYTADAATNFTTVVPNSRLVLLGSTKKNGIPILHESHSGGTVMFGTDGSLLISTGDGASYGFIDGGNGATYWSQAITDSIIRPNENVGAFRAQMINSYNGKILRIDPATGEGLNSNPFYDSSNPNSAQSKVWAMGLRNPFRMTLKPGTGNIDPTAGDPGVLYIGDVGWDTWEDFNICKGPGQNFGWPLYEGLTPQTGYTNLLTDNKDALNPLFGFNGCNRQYFQFQELLKNPSQGQISFNNPCDNSQQITSYPVFIHSRPVIDYKHGNESRTGNFTAGVATTIDLDDPLSPFPGPRFGGNASVGGTWYTGTKFPLSYQNTYFHGDYVAGWIKNITLDGNDNPLQVSDFGSSLGPCVYIAMNPKDEAIYYVKYSNQIRKITYTGVVNNPPVPIAQQSVVYGPGPLTVNFTGHNSTDPENHPLTYSWNFGDGFTSTSADSVHTFTATPGVPTTYTVVLSVTDDALNTRSDSLQVFVNNTPPQVQITSFNDGDLYSVSHFTNLHLEAAVTDLEHGPNQLFYEWLVLFHHNIHTHPEPVDTNKITDAVISPIGCSEVYYYEVRLKVTDAAGLSTSVNGFIYPACDPPVATFTASSQLICGTGQVSFTDQTTNLPDSWEWSFPGASPSTSTAQNPIVTYNTPGLYDVQLISTSSRGSDTLLLPDYIKVVVPPQVTVTSNPPAATTFCAGTVFTLTANSPSVIASYQWTRYAVNISGATSQSYVVPKTGNYKVIVTDNNGCSTTSSKSAITKFPVPPVHITASGPLAFCPGDSVKLSSPSTVGYTYQWKKYANNISGATLPNYFAKTTGTYKLISTTANGCPRASNQLVVTVSCLDGSGEQKSSSLIAPRLYPNPASNEVTIDFSMDKSGMVSLQLADITGRQIDILKDMNLDSGMQQIKFAVDDLTPGLYQVVLSSPGKIETLRLVISESK